MASTSTRSGRGWPEARRFPVDWYQWRLRLEAAWHSPGAVFEDEAGRAAPDVGGIWLHAGLLW